MELRKYQHQDADVLELTEGKMTNGVSASRGPVLRSLRPQTRLETSCTRTGRPREHRQPKQAAGRRVKAKATRPAGMSPRSRTAE